MFALDTTTGRPAWRTNTTKVRPFGEGDTDKTTGLDVRHGKRIFSLHQAGYTPVISDGRRLYAIGYFELVGLRPSRH